MPLIEVAFKGNRKEFFAWEGEQVPAARTSVIVEADRGEDLGVVHAIGDLAHARCLGCSHGSGSAAPTRKALRVASSRDVRQAQDLRAQDETARHKATERVKAHGLVMKLSDAEWQWDRKKLTFYFTAERRVDFRNLVRDLAALFRARIELKQIGVRDEAKRLDGVGRCGRQYCSAGWLPELRPVNLGVAKDQHLSLNPSQISGACGRLMCCLRYEHEFYVQSRKRFPKEGRIVVTEHGEEKVVANDIFNERVTLRSADGEARVVPLAQLRRELALGDPADGAASTVAAEQGADDAAGSGVADEDEVDLEDEADVSLGDEDTEVEGTLDHDSRPDFEPRTWSERAPPDGGSGGHTVSSPPPASRRRDGGSDSHPDEAERSEVSGSGEVHDAGGSGPAGPRRRRGRRGGRRGRGRGSLGGEAPRPEGSNPPSDPTGGAPSGGQPVSDGLAPGTSGPDSRETPDPQPDGSGEGGSAGGEPES